MQVHAWYDRGVSCQIILMWYGSGVYTSNSGWGKVSWYCRPEHVVMRRMVDTVVVVLN